MDLARFDRLIDECLWRGARPALAAALRRFANSDAALARRLRRRLRLEAALRRSLPLPRELNAQPLSGAVRARLQSEAGKAGGGGRRARDTGA